MRAQTALYAPQPDGSTLAEFGASIQEQTGSWPEDIPEPPDIPPALEHLWAWFWQLRTANPSAGFGPAPLSFGEMDAWQRVTGNRLEPWLWIRCWRWMRRSWPRSRKRGQAAGEKHNDLEKAGANALAFFIRAFQLLVAYDCFFYRRRLPCHRLTHDICNEGIQ